MRSIFLILFLSASSFIYACDKEHDVTEMELSKDSLPYKTLWVGKDNINFHGKLFTSIDQVKPLLNQHSKNEFYIGIEACGSKEKYFEIKTYAESIGIKNIIEAATLCICTE